MWVINEINRGELEIRCRVISQIHARFMRYIPKKIAAAEGTGRDQLADGLFC